MHYHNEYVFLSVIYLTGCQQKTTNRRMEEVNETVQILNETAKNETTKIPSTPEGMAVAYGSLLVMAMLPIFFGAFRSVRYQKEQKVNRSSSICYASVACGQYGYAYV